MTATTFAPPVADGLFATDPASLLGGRCADCGTLHFPRRGVCPQCQGVQVAEAPLATTGNVYTFTIVHAAPPGYLGSVPYAIGVVELTDGLRVTSTLVADDLESLQIGDPVAFELIALGEGEERVTSFAYRRGEAAQ